MDRYDVDYRWTHRETPHIDIVIFSDAGTVTGMCKDPKGDWCKWEDVQSLQRENERLREYLDKMIKGGEITETLSKGNDYYESKGALEAFKAVKALLTKEKN